jgi:hypothetical protein
MAAYRCDDPRLEAALRGLERLVREAGGWFDDSLTVHAKDGNLTLHSSQRPSGSVAPDPRDALIALPRAALVPVEHFRFSLSGNALRAAPSGEGASPLRAKICAAMAEIYNLTGKIAAHRKRAPALLGFDHPHAADVLYAGRPELRAAAGAPSPHARETFLIETFLQTRKVNLGSTGLGHALAPFFDFADHHALAYGVVSEPLRDPGDALALFNSQPVRGSDACFVRYGLYDAYDLFLIYNFLDRETPFARSVPLTLDLGAAGKIAIRAGGANAAVDAAKGDFLWPSIAVPFPGMAEASFLIIPPPGYRDAFVEVLERIVAELNPYLDAETRGRLVAEATRQALDFNSAFYRAFDAKLGTLQGEAAAHPALVMAREMAAVQQGRLAAFAKAAAS